MADLTSKEWRDLIFQNKNKDFGAYTMRKNSEKRHTLAVIFTLIGLAIIILIVIGYSQLSAKWAAEREEELRLERERMAALAQQEEEAETHDEEDNIEIPLIEEVPIIEEQVLETKQQTQIAIVDKEDVKHIVDSNVEQQEDDSARGTVTQEGASDADNFEAVKEQVIVVPEPPKEEPKKAEPKEDEIFTYVEQPPTFPGGESALMEWLGKNLVYPMRAQEDGVSGKTIVGFVVEKDGSISNVQVVRSSGNKDLDNAATAVVKKMPKWQAGKNNGHSVRAFFNLPVNFVLR